MPFRSCQTQRRVFQGETVAAAFAKIGDRLGASGRLVIGEREAEAWIPQRGSNTPLKSIDIEPYVARTMPTQGDWIQGGISLIRSHSTTPMCPACADVEQCNNFDMHLYYNDYISRMG